jgi:hypothetical protein
MADPRYDRSLPRTAWSAGYVEVNTALVCFQVEFQEEEGALGLACFHEGRGFIPCSGEFWSKILFSEREGALDLFFMMRGLPRTEWSAGYV